MAHSIDPMMEPKGLLRMPPQDDNRTREFSATTAGSRPRPRTNTGPNRRVPPYTEPKRRMSRGSTVMAWVLATIVVLFILGMISQKVNPDTTNGPHPSPTVTVTKTVTPKAHHT